MAQKISTEFSEVSVSTETPSLNVEAGEIGLLPVASLSATVVARRRKNKCVEDFDTNKITSFTAGPDFSIRDQSLSSSKDNSKILSMKMANEKIEGDLLDKNGFNSKNIKEERRGGALYYSPNVRKLLMSFFMCLLAFWFGLMGTLLIF
jgi:hypothetical protein